MEMAKILTRMGVPLVNNRKRVKIRRIRMLKRHLRHWLKC